MNLNIDQTHLQIVIHFSNELLLIIISLLLAISIYGLKHYTDKIPRKAAEPLCHTCSADVYHNIKPPSWYGLLQVTNYTKRFNFLLMSHARTRHTCRTHVIHCRFTNELWYYSAHMYLITKWLAISITLFDICFQYCFEYSRLNLQ